MLGRKQQASLTLRTDEVSEWPQRAASTTPENLIELQIFEPHLSSKFWRWGSEVCGLGKALR